MARRGGIPVNGLVRLFTAAAFIAGATTGVYFTLSRAHPAYDRLLADINVYLNAVNAPGETLAYFLRRALQYAVPVVTVWFLAYVPPLSALAYAVLFIRTYGTAFTAASVWNTQGSGCVVFSVVLLGPQSLIFLPALCYITCGCVRQGMGQIRANLVTGGAKARELGARMRLHVPKNDYAFNLLLGILTAVTAALVETWLTPVLMRYVFIL